MLKKDSEESFQLADKGVSTAKMMKSFGQAFSKACAVEGAEPSSPPSDGEIPFSAFLFDNFFFAPLASKKKWLTNLYDRTNSLFMMRFVSSLKGLGRVLFYCKYWRGKRARYSPTAKIFASLKCELGLLCKSEPFQGEILNSNTR